MAVKMERDLLGTVISDPTSNHRFRVQLKQGSEVVWVQISEDLPVKKLDLFSGFCRLDRTTWVPIEKPFFTPNPTKTSIQQAFRTALRGKIGAPVLNLIYGNLIAMYNTPRKVAKFISRYAADVAAGGPIAGNDVHFDKKLQKDQLQQILKWWNWNWSRRSLLLLGLQSSDLEDLNRFNYEELHTQLVKDPIEAYEIDMDLTLEIAERLGTEITADEQKLGAVPRFIYACSRYRKWTGVPLDRLLGTFPNLQQDQQMLIRVIKRFDLVFDQDAQMLLLPYQAKVQKLLAERVHALMESNKLPRAHYDPNYLMNRLDCDQKAAVEGALNSQISVITGPAGSGKTSVISELIHNLKLRDRKYMLVSFTGKAVSRIRKTTGEEASTMDRMIFWAPEARFETLIIDEAGMVSNELLYRFLKTFTHQFQLILIGDPYQLQPISWGTAFHRLIGFIPTFRLTQNHRLAQVDTENNTLAQNLEEIVSDPDYLPLCSDTFEMDPPDVVRPIESIQALVKMIAEEEDDPNCITVLCPYRSGGELDRINEMISVAFNGDKPEITDSAGKTFRVGDRIKMCKNEHTRELYNGEEGMVEDVSPTKVRTRFDGDREYEFETFIPRYSVPGQALNTDKLRLSFGKTVHDDQGDEHAYVILYIPPRKHSPGFLNRSLIYTAVSRAQIAFFCVGDTAAFITAARADPPIRHDNLRSEIEKLQK